MNTTLRELSLAHLSVLDVAPPELVTVAAAAGFRKIGIRISATPSVGGSALRHAWRHAGPARDAGAARVFLHAKRDLPLVRRPAHG